MAPRLVIAADSQSFDQTIISNWEQEGYDVTFVALNGNSKSLILLVEGVAEQLEDQEAYAVVAYGDAASILLHQAFFDPLPRLCALVTFYPPSLPDPSSMPPNGLRVQVHLAGDQPFAPRYPSYSYPLTSTGFAERGGNSYDKISSNLAWSRSLDCIQRGFGIEVDLENVWEHHLAMKFQAKDAGAALKSMSSTASVNNVPTGTGGVGAKELLRFYQDFFISCNPSSLYTKLLSRTIGSDRIVDEMLLKFTHTHEIPWMLPGVPPTGKNVEIAVVAIVCLRGGRLYHENFYWDQASVLVQIGLLDPKLGALGLGINGLTRLPVLGVETARNVSDEGSMQTNLLIPDW